MRTPVLIEDTCTAARQVRPDLAQDQEVGAEPGPDVSVESPVEGRSPSVVVAAGPPLSKNDLGSGESGEKARTDASSTIRSMVFILFKYLLVSILNTYIWH